MRPPPFRSGRGRPFSLPVRQHGDNRVEGEARAASRPRRNRTQIFLRWRVPSPSGRFPPQPARPGSLRAPKARFLLLLPSRRVARGRRRRGEGGGGAWTRASGHQFLAHLHLSSSHHPRPPSPQRIGRYSRGLRPASGRWNEFRSGDSVTARVNHSPQRLPLTAWSPTLASTSSGRPPLMPEPRQAQHSEGLPEEGGGAMSSPCSYGELSTCSEPHCSEDLQ